MNNYRQIQLTIFFLYNVMPENQLKLWIKVEKFIYRTANTIMIYSLDYPSRLEITFNYENIALSGIPSC